MADYYTHFSCLLDTGTPEVANRAIALYLQLLDEDQDRDDPEWHGFDVSLAEPESSLIWIHSEDSGDVENVVAFVLRCAEEFDLSGLWGFTYSHSCSRPRIDAFGGGAQVIDLGARKSIGWMDAAHWLQAALNGQDPDE